jgi:hypothetical protein
MVKTTCVFILSLAFTSLLAVSEGLADSSCRKDHSSSFNWHAIKAPPLRTGIGNSEFPITTTSKKAQTFFTQGVNALHAFWDYEALRAFKYSSELDPNTLMPHWGIVMAISGNASESAKKVKLSSLEKIRSLLPNTSDRESLYGKAITTLNDGLPDARERYSAIMRELIEKYPEDADAKAFLALSLMDGYSNNIPSSSQPQSEELLKLGLKSHPNHVGLNHYWIHAVEQSPTPDRALENAKLLSKLAPNAGHIVHMAGHIYFLTGDFKSAIDVFSDAKIVDKKYLNEEHVHPFENWNYLHNLSYLTFVAAETGQVVKGIAWAKEVEAIHFPHHPVDSPGASRFLYESLQARTFLHLRLSQWERAAQAANEILQRKEVTNDKFVRAYYLGLIAYAEAKRFLELSKLEESKESLESLEASLHQIRIPREYRNHSHFSKTAKSILSIFALELRGAIENVKGKPEQAKIWFNQAIENEIALGYREPPALPYSMAEAAGVNYLRSGLYEDAKTAFQLALSQRKNSGPVLYYIALTSTLIENFKTADEYIEGFRLAFISADKDLVFLKLGLELQNCLKLEKSKQCAM